MLPRITYEITVGQINYSNLLEFTTKTLKNTKISNKAFKKYSENTNKRYTTMEYSTYMPTKPICKLQRVLRNNSASRTQYERES